MLENDFVKLTNALYKVLEFLPDSDPLKNRAKEKALAILEHSTPLNQVQGFVSLKSLLSLESQKTSLTLLTDIEMLQQYLSIAKGQGWISDVNFLIINKEYDAIKHKISLPAGVLRQTIETKPVSQTNVLPNIEPFKKTETPKITTAVDGVPAQGGKEPTIAPYSARQNTILKILAKRQKAQVADLIKELPNITKRTIRRDLDELLKRGEIVRAGQWNQIFYQPKSWDN